MERVLRSMCGTLRSQCCSSQAFRTLAETPYSWPFSTFAVLRWLKSGEQRGT